MRPWFLLCLAGCTAAEQAPLPDAAEAETDGCAVLGMYGDGTCDSGCVQPDPDCGLIVIGHRGSPHSAAENTMPSFRAAVAEGADAVEIDLCLSEDGQVLIVHDCDPSTPMARIRQTGLEGLPWVPWVPAPTDPFHRPVHELTAAEVREHWGYARLATMTQRDPAAQIPTFAEFVPWAAGEARLEAVWLDIKIGPSQLALAQEMAASIGELTEDSGVAFYVLSPFPEVLEAMRTEIRTRHPGHPARFILDIQSSAGFGDADRLDSDGYSAGTNPFWAWSEYLAALRAHAGERFPLVVWTIDDEREARELVGAGADAIMTNVPAMAVRLRQQAL